MKVKVTIERREVLAAIAKYLLDHGVPLVAGQFYLFVKYDKSGSWIGMSDSSEIKAEVEYECEALSSDQGAIDTGKPA